MKRYVNSLLSFLLILAVLLSLCVGAFAADATVSYEGNAKKYIFAPGSDQSPTDLFPDFKGVMPGDRLTQKITVKNNAGNKVKVKIYLRALGAKEGSEEFLSQLNLLVKENGDSILFDAPAHVTDGLTDWVCLGTLYSGGHVDLDVILNVPIEMGNDFQDAIGYLDWQFRVEELPVESTDPSGPNTGVDTHSIVYWTVLGVGVCLLGAALVIFFAGKKKKKEENQ